MFAMMYVNRQNHNPSSCKAYRIAIWYQLNAIKIVYTSTAQGGGSFQDRKPIGEGWGVWSDPLKEPQAAWIYLFVG